MWGHPGTSFYQYLPSHCSLPTSLPRTTASGTGSVPIAHLSKLSNKWMQPPSKAREAGTSQESAV